MNYIYHCVETHIRCEYRGIVLWTAEIKAGLGISRDFVIKEANRIRYILEENLDNNYIPPSCPTCED